LRSIGRQVLACIAALALQAGADLTLPQMAAAPIIG
jgi:hypothetical protein